MERPTAPAEMDRRRRRATLSGMWLDPARPLSGRKSPLTTEMRVAYVIEICGVGVWVLLLLRLLVLDCQWTRTETKEVKVVVTVGRAREAMTVTEEKAE